MTSEANGAAAPAAALTPFQKSLDQTYDRLQNGLRTKARGYDWRMEQLRALKALLVENEKALSAAMWKDLRKSEFECTATEQGVVISEIDVTLKKLKKWMRPKSVSTPLYNQIGRSQIVHDPLGLALIIGAWNYPINLLLAPLVGAISGGNAAILKPSEISANTAELIGTLIPKYMDPELFAVIQGGAEETGLLLDKKFDTIFFTGSGNVGKIILAKAAPHLTPVTLELGGKSPAVVLKDADLTVTARRIVWGKFMNAGQTCVAPDYVIAVPEIREPLIAEMKKVLQAFYGERPIENADYCRIINQKNFDRLMKLKEGVEILHGGDARREELYIAPTLLSAGAESAIMQEEIFGPLLPILEMKEVSEAVAFINARPKPLSLYVFTKDGAQAERFVNETSSGAVCVNDVVIHMPIPSLPFGGVGASGMGHYHGKFSFETFTHAKGVLKKSTLLDVPVRYPPYSETKRWWMQWLFR